MADDTVDHMARGMASDAKQHILSHEALDNERFLQMRDDVKGLQGAQKEMSDKMDGIYRTLNAKMDGLKDMIGSRPTWTISTIIGILLGVIGFLSARVWPA